MNNQAEIEKIHQAIIALEAQRQSLGDEVVETALTPLRGKLASLKTSDHYEQRKLATVLFADLVGFTELSSHLDPEDMRELLNAYFERCRMSIEQYGGVIEKYIGDAVMAVFGLNISREDDPARAIHAGLEISRVLEQIEANLTRVPDRSLAIRVGINTGEVVVGALGERQEDEFVVVGEAVNVASRLQSAAPAGGVLITHDTYRHVRGVFEVQPVEPLHLKGIDSPVRAYLVKAAKPRAFRMTTRGVEGVETLVVGREAELNRLKEAFDHVVQDRQRQVLTVVGEAGIGKSRLIAEFEDWLELLPQKVYYFKGRAHPSMQTIPYSLVRDIFAFRFQIHDSDSPTTVRQKLERGYTQAFPSLLAGETREKERRSKVRASHFIGRLLGFEFGLSEHLQAIEQDARGLHDQALVYLRDFFVALGNDNPVIVLLEDLHWADGSSLDLIQHLGNSLRQLPLLIVGATRPGLFERRPDWSENRPFHHHLDLGPISRQDSRSLVEQILHKVEDLPEVLVDLVVSTAEGNPFFIEELLKMLIEDGIIQTQELRWQVESERLAEIRIPPTLMGVLQARFDTLPVQERSYLQRGSVIGRVFWDKAIDYLGKAANTGADRPDTSATELPGKLRDREMIFERENSTFEDTREYVFKHALVRDVTYESLLKRWRRIFHRQAARWLEQVTERSGRADEFAALIAGHYEQAGEPAPAAEWYWRAGQGAANRYANAEAVHAFSHALELTPQEDVGRQFEIRLSRENVYGLQGVKEERIRDLEELQALSERLADPARQARVALRRAEYAFFVSDFPEVIASAQRAGELAKIAQVMDIAAESDLLQANALIRKGSLGRAWEFAQQGLDLARQHGIQRAEANSLRHLGLIAYYMGSHQEASNRFAEALELYVEIGDRQGEGMALNNLGGATFDLGDYQQAEVYYSRALELCREIGDRIGEGRAFNNLGIITVVQSDYAQAEDYYLQALQISREVGYRSFEMSALDNLGNLALYTYRFSRARTYQLESLQGAREIGDRVTESFSLINLTRGCLMTGDYETAHNYIQSGLELTREIGDLKGECELLASMSQYQCETGDPEAARAKAQQALDHSREHGFQTEEGCALHQLGEAALTSGDAQAAYAHFLAALDIRRRLDEAGDACDSQAGLARACLDLGDVDQALIQVEQLLDTWHTRGTFGLNQPVMDMLTCYKVLVATQDPRAPSILERGYQLLQECAANIGEDDLRRAFLENVSAHRDLQAIWKAGQSFTLRKP